MVDMFKLHWLTFEINNECPLTKEHPQCPRSHDRFKNKSLGDPITTQEIIDFVNLCTKTYGFNGLIALHYYNEPLCTKKRVFQLAHAFPDKITLRTNGILFETPLSLIDEAIIDLVHDIYITVYPGYEKKTERFLGRPKFDFWRLGLDNRALENSTPSYLVNILNRCGRPDWELITDYYGYLHLCCSDWKGEMHIGNIKTDNWANCIDKWDHLRQYIKSNQPWDEAHYHILPPVCKRCLILTPHIPQVGL